MHSRLVGRSIGAPKWAMLASCLILFFNWEYGCFWLFLDAEHILKLLHYSYGQVAGLSLYAQQHKSMCSALYGYGYCDLGTTKYLKPFLYTNLYFVVEVIQNIKMVECCGLSTALSWRLFSFFCDCWKGSWVSLNVSVLNSEYRKNAVKLKQPQ